MNIQDIHEQVKKQRELRFRGNQQLSLGEFIKELESVDFKMEHNDEIKDVEFDFGTALPTQLDSWRGSYDEIALGYKLSGYDNNDEHFANTKADKLLEHLKSAIGKEYEGYKGGDFTMDENTPVWVANYGHSGNTGVVGVLDAGYKLVIITAYCEY
jgi:hypothetical protein